MFLNLCWHQWKFGVEDDVKYIFKFSKPYWLPAPHFNASEPLYKIGGGFIYGKYLSPSPPVLLSRPLTKPPPTPKLAHTAWKK